MRRHRIWIAGLTVAFLSGCTSGAATTVAPLASVPGAPTVAATAVSTQGAAGAGPSGGAVGQKPADIDVCRLLGLGDVQANSPFTTPFVSAESQVSPTVCLYSNWNVTSPPIPEPVSVIVRVTGWTSPAEALASLRVSEKDASDRNISPTPIAGLGDAASAFPGGDEVSVEAVAGQRTVEVKLKGQFPDIGDAQKVPAGTAIAKLVISRLP